MFFSKTKGLYGRVAMRGRASTVSTSSGRRNRKSQHFSIPGRELLSLCGRNACYSIIVVGIA